MNIDDFVNGSTFIYIKRSYFKDENIFENICSFLKIPITANAIKLDV